MSTGAKRILIIDDDADQLFLGRSLLAREGYEVLTHQSPFGVAGLIEAAEPDLLLIDVNMPALPGDSLAALLKSDDRTRHVPIVLFSALDEALLQRTVRLNRLQGYIRKGDMASLRMMVGFFLKEHETDCSAYRKRLYAVE